MSIVAESGYFGSISTPPPPKVRWGVKTDGANLSSICADCASWTRNLCPLPLLAIVKTNLGAVETLAPPNKATQQQTAAQIQVQFGL